MTFTSLSYSIYLSFLLLIYLVLFPSSLYLFALSFYLFFKKWSIAGLFLVYFWSFSNKHYNFYINTMWKCPSSIRCCDLNPRPPITTRPGPPPSLYHCFVQFLFPCQSIFYLSHSISWICHSISYISLFYHADS